MNSSDAKQSDIAVSALVRPFSRTFMVADVSDTPILGYAHERFELWVAEADAHSCKLGAFDDPTPDFSRSSARRASTTSRRAHGSVRERYRPSSCVMHVSRAQFRLQRKDAW
jgi:hypothetical protein